MGIFSFLGFGNSSVRNALKNGAVVIDVRTASEFDRGRVPGSLNIPVDRIAVSIPRIRGMERPVVLVCSSGHRSRNALRILKENGVKEVYNGGSWENVVGMLNNL
jgi:rhodanese-related sulfurtransferase